MSALLHAGWPAPRGVHALTTLRHGAGVSAAPFDRFNLGNHRSAAGDDPDAVARNRALLVGLAGLPGRPVWLHQVHGIDVARVDAPMPAGDATRIEADAAVTRAPGVVLAIQTADCLPVVFAAREGSEIGAAHAGWRGLAAGVLEATLAAMRTAPASLVVWLGPAAGPAAYEIGAEVREAFVNRDADAATAFVPTRPGHWRVDLYALARLRLIAAGVPGDAIHGGEHCTISEPEAFFSHRRDQRTGRMATLAWMDPVD
ncbi:peptidoglycan editing factor PgeF [Luteimonas deserti]|uniref:Purine nucleoside phosphorylase n=1 Tax=Luteimonas deserti TaxID=2752306 RepID=A0A7Z0TYG6_9GAMM|nr:peptidoglycan editing factor PgeF [Luteimonas deserti]NYZ62347.1 peptidoglycan editing factor PgeF [Luteimonas deserti]